MTSGKREGIQEEGRGSEEMGPHEIARIPSSELELSTKSILRCWGDGSLCEALAIQGLELELGPRIHVEKPSTVWHCVYSYKPSTGERVQVKPGPN